MIMNGVEVVDDALANTETRISNMPGEENVASSEESVIETREQGMVGEVKTEEDMEALKTQLRHQLEYYFSSENLTRDQYLVSQMDDQQYVPIWTIANFNLVKNLTTDINLITEVLKSSNLVQVDEKNEKVRPNQTKFALILREIPEDTPVKSVEALFDDEECPKFLSCEFAANTSWYVSFETSADVQAAYRHLREKVRTFLGKPILARIKSKTHHFNTYSSSKLKPQSGIPGPILSPPYVQPVNVFTPPQPGTPYSGQAPPFIAAIATQPPGSTSPHSSTVSTTAAQTHLYVVPPGPQQWYTAEPVPNPYGNQAFGSAVFQSVTPQAIPNYMGGKRNPMYGNKGNYLNNNYLSSDMQPGRSIQQDNRIVQLQPVNPAAPDSRPHHYLPAVPAGHLKVPMGGQQNPYAQNVMPSPYFKKGGKQNGNMPNGVGPRYNRGAFPNSHQDSDISPRFQKKGMQPQHHHPRYSTSRNNQTVDYTSRHNSEGSAPYLNGPSCVHDPYVNPPYVTRNNSTGHDNATLNGARLGSRQGYTGKFQDVMDGPYSPNDLNNNAIKRQQNLGNDTVQTAPYADHRGMIPQRQRSNKFRKNGDSRSSSARPSPPLNGPGLREETFNLENTSFPPLPGAAASNAAANPVTSSTEAVSKKPQVPEESYKNSLKMNLVPSVPTTTAAPQAPTVRSNPVAKEDSMQLNTQEQAPQKDVNIDKEITNATGPAGKTPAKGPKAAEQRLPATTGDMQQMAPEKTKRPSQKQTKGNKTEARKGKSEPNKSNTSDKDTVSAAEIDAVKKLSYAEMLRKKTPKPTTAASDESDNRTEPKPDCDEEGQSATQTVASPKTAEKTDRAVNGGSKTSEKAPPSPAAGSEDGDEKPWESAGPTKRSHRADRSSTDHSHHNGHDSREGGYQRNGRGGGFSNRGNGRGRGRGRGGYGRGGSRYNGNGRERYNSAGNDRQVINNGDSHPRKR